MRTAMIIQALLVVVVVFIASPECHAFFLGRHSSLPRKHQHQHQPGITISMASESSATMVADNNNNNEKELEMDQQQQQHQQQNNIDHDLIWKLLLDRFQGDFDNYEQVVQDRKENLLPREGGGHENFHCTLIPVSETGRLAAFYFDGNPKRIFRFRYYELRRDNDNNNHNNNDDDSSSSCGVEMKLYTLNPELEGLLRSNSENPLEWPSIYSNFKVDDDDEAEKVTYLPNCEITWSLDIDPVQHSYTKLNDEQDGGIHAVMVHGEAIVDSTIIPGVKIRILDQLSLYENTFYINDRGLDPESGAFIYGNQRGVPYRLERVSALENGKRAIVNEDLRWTMGEQWRSEEEYEEKLNAAGGPSVGMKRPPPTKS